YDSYDNQTYALDNAYMQAGIGATIDSDLASAATPADSEAMVSEALNALFNLHMLEADYNDSTPYNQAHATDLEMLAHYNLQNKTVLMISTVEQAMRVYQNGKLLRAFHVTTGRSELPSLPGVWGVLERKSPIIFQSADPKGSPYWFPDTPIKYAILYHYGGYFVHDAWWRANFGPGTEFPHSDASGTSAYNFDGSHGCINLSETDAAWVYQHTDWNTQIVIY
ncbi:MAG TPA: L,D-transpeptidase, partial [Ktedonobacteraceae bacterium]|nr:L,D-transpeptidase [Ktedonobacteraceae bacterium]